ncbi:MAG: sulfurtransferase [Gammaproteobacteria bacterium]|nr:sulfurtransferase [Gammaproteobacteria bacterium]MCD8543175.1 sulfurtransferase [Gammaproteobacteria bacterium]
MTKHIVNVSTYKFVALDQLEKRKEYFLMLCKHMYLLGTILLSQEGINIMIAGTRDQIDLFSRELRKDPCFTDIVFKESFSETVPFKRMRVRIKPEIITMGIPSVDRVQQTGKHIKPSEFKTWLDEGRDVVVLDTRNDYEVDFGTFENAIDPKIDNFQEFPEFVDGLDPSLKEKPIVMFCTGGVRCEKASIMMEQKGFKHVYQIDGGILKYFEETGGEHWQGDCFVFDERIALNKRLEPTGAAQCHVCGFPVNLNELDSPDYIPNISCPKCIHGKPHKRRYDRCQQTHNQ